MSWNPRFVAYAKAHNRTPEEMLVLEEERFPGGKMAGYMLWVGGRWREWRAIHGICWDAFLSEEDYREFDAWLAHIP